MKINYYILLILFFLPGSFLFSQIKRLEAVKNESFIKYKVTHPLHEVTATSKYVLCLADVDLKTKQVKAVSVQVAVTSFDSGNSNRDSHAMEVVEALLYPDARFISSSVTQKGDSLQVWGNLTFHGITKKIHLDAIDHWTSKKLTVDGGFNISLTAFHIKRPSLLLMPINDKVQFTFEQVFNL